MVHRTIPNPRQPTTKPAAVAAPASCVADLVAKALCGYCQQLKSARNYRALMHISYYCSLTSKQHIHRRKVTLLLSSVRTKLNEYKTTQMLAAYVRASLLEDSRYDFCLCNFARDPSLAWLAGAGTIASGSTGRHPGTSGWRRNYAGFQVRGGWWSSGGYLIYSSCMPRVVCKVRMGFPSGDCCGPLEY